MDFEPLVGNLLLSIKQLLFGDEVQPRSGDRTVAHGVSHGIPGARTTKPRRGVTLSSLASMFRRAAADVSITFVSHGSRRGLQIFRRSAAGSK